MWKKLSKKRLESLKKINNRILLYSTVSGYPYDIIEFLDECEPDDKNHWWSMLHDNNLTDYHCYEDFEVLDLFTHYHILQVPETEKLSKKDAFMYWMDGK